MKTQDQVAVSVRLPRDISEAFDRLAAATNQSKSFHIRMALEAGLPLIKEKAQEKYQILVKAIQQVQQEDQVK